MFARREALPKACLLHIEEELLVHYLTNLLPSMSIIAIEESVRMRKSSSSVCLCSYQTGGNIDLRTLPIVEELKEKRMTSAFFSATKPTFIGRCTSPTPKPLVELLHSKLKSRHLEENVRCKILGLTFFHYRESTI